MKNSRSLILVAALVLALSAATTQAQRPRITDPDDGPARTTQSTQQQQQAGQPAPPAAPQSVKAKYEGGMIGYKKSDGTLNYDDQNSRLLFRDKQGREIFSIPYKSIQAAWPDTQSRRPTAATVASAIPLPYGANMGAWFIRKKYRYLVVQYSDPDTSAAGITSFKLADKELLASVLHTLGNKAGMVQRGEAFVRRREAPASSSGSATIP